MGNIIKYIWFLTRSTSANVNSKELKGMSLIMVANYLR